MATSDSFSNPKDLGLLTAFLSMLEQGGPQTRPTSIGQAISRSGMAGIGAYQQAQERQKEEGLNKIRMQLMQAQMQDYQSKARRNDALAERDIDEKTTSDMMNGIAYMESHNAANPDNPITLHESMLKMKRAGPAFMGIPQQLGSDGRYRLPPDISPYADTAQRLGSAKQRGVESERIFESTGPSEQQEYTTGSAIQKMLDDMRGQFSEARLPSAGAGFPSVSPADQAQRDEERKRMLRDEIAGATDPATKAALEKELARTRGGAAYGTPPVQQVDQAQFQQPGVPPFRPPSAGAPAIAGQKAEQEAIGKAKGESTARTDVTNPEKAKKVLQILSVVDPVIDKATGSLVGYGRDVALSAIGRATEEGRAIAKLKVIQAQLMANMPRMEGPQSDRDVELYKDQAGRIGDPQSPASVKRAAVKTIIELNSKYAGIKQVDFDWSQEKEERFQRWKKEQGMSDQ